MKKSVKLKEEVLKVMDSNNIKYIIAAALSEKTKVDPKDSLKLVENMFNNSIEDLEKQLASINNNIDKK